MMDYRNDWRKCVVCGRYVSYADLDSGAAKINMVTPDSYYTREEYETLCRKCNASVRPTPEAA